VIAAGQLATKEVAALTHVVVFVVVVWLLTVLKHKIGQVSASLNAPSAPYVGVVASILAPAAHCTSATEFRSSSYKERNHPLLHGKNKPLPPQWQPLLQLWPRRLHTSNLHRANHRRNSLRKHHHNSKS